MTHQAIGLTPSPLRSQGCLCGGRRLFLKGLTASAMTLASATVGLAQTVATPRGAGSIDVHHHLSSPQFIAAIKARNTGQTSLMNWTPEQSLADMDEGHVATSILSISEPGVFFGDAAQARALARETNDYGADLIARHSPRFGMFATLPLPDVEGSLREIAYALDVLKMDGVCMMTDYQGKFLGDPMFWPVMEELNRRKAIVFTHPFRNDCCRNLVPDVPEPIVELGTDTSRTIASLLFSGTAAKFADIRFVFSHAGGTAPMLLQRFAGYFVARKDLQSRLPAGPAHYLGEFFYDTANASTVAPLASLVKVARPTQILFGTDYPFVTAKATAAGLAATELFSEAELGDIARGNALRLMPRYKS